MKITKRQLREMINESLNEFWSGDPDAYDTVTGPSQDANRVINSVIDAIKAMRGGESFEYEITGAQLNALLGASQSGILHAPDAGLSGDAKLILGLAGMVSILVVIAIALSYSVEIEGSTGDTKGRIVFVSPGDEPKELEGPEPEELES